MSKVTSKLQVTLPKHIADRFQIRPGSEIEFVPAGDMLHVALPGSPAQALTGDERLALFDRATERIRARGRRARAAAGDDRGWTRADLYTRGRTR